MAEIEKKVGWDEVYILKEYESAMVESKLQTDFTSWDKGYLRKQLLWKKRKENIFLVSPVISDNYCW